MGEPLSTDRIVELAARPDGFSVHRFRWSDAKLAKKCRKLVRSKRLSVLRHERDHTVYAAAQPAAQQKED